MGDTVFNMLRLATGHLEDGDRPKYPHRITGTKVLVNPFDDIVPRVAIVSELDKGVKKKKSKAKAHKAFNVLSFGAQAEEEEEDLELALKADKGKSKSAHDLANDPKLMGVMDKHQARDEMGQEEGSSELEEAEDPEEGAMRKRMKQQANLDGVKNKLKRKADEKEIMDIRTKSKKADAVEDFIKKEQSKAENEDDFEGDYECPILKEQAKRKQEIQKELKALTKELRLKKKNTSKGFFEEEKEDMTEDEKKNDMLASYHKEQKKYKTNQVAKPIPKSKASREEETLALLAKFKTKLSGFKFGDDDEDALKTTEEEPKKDGDEKKDEDDDEEIVGDDWIKNTLVFESDAPVLAKDASTKDDDAWDIYDPRNPLNKRRREKDAGDAKKEKDRLKMSL